MRQTVFAGSVTGMMENPLCLPKQRAPRGTLSQMEMLGWSIDTVCWMKVCVGRGTLPMLESRVDVVVVVVVVVSIEEGMYL